MERHFNTVHVDLAALAHNLKEVRRLVGPRVRIMGVVKGDAYGHGLVRAGRCLIRAGADALGVMDLNEAAGLRNAGVTGPVFILAGITPVQCPDIVALNLTPFIYETALARELNEAARRRGRRAHIHLKLDTGMNRLGVRHDRSQDFLEAINDLDHLEVTGLATHLAEADVPDSEFNQIQIERLTELISAAGTRGLKDLNLNNAANSAAVLGLEAAHLDMVRPGLMLYGAHPADHLKERADLKPVMSMTSRVAQVKRLPPGAAVSYGRTWRADRETIMATVPVGYTHGFNRLLSNKGWALIRGQKAPVRGRVCMNLTMFDVTGIPGVVPGDEVMLLGRQGREVISGRTLADLTGTIDYEVFCLMGGMNHKEYLNDPG